MSFSRRLLSSRANGTTKWKSFCLFYLRSFSVLRGNKKLNVVYKHPAHLLECQHLLLKLWNHIIDMINVVAVICSLYFRFLHDNNNCFLSTCYYCYYFLCKLVQYLQIQGYKCKKRSCIRINTTSFFAL